MELDDLTNFEAIRKKETELKIKEKELVEKVIPV